MSGGWAIVNLAIVGASWKQSKPPVRRRLREFLWLNQGLNAGYIGVGVAMASLGGLAVAGMGWGVIIQGLALLALDGLLLTRVPVGQEVS
jgi:hypothetical protein